jgi:hypothetical protein
MVSHCVNPACDAEFRIFHSGYLFAHERQSADTEFFWLCPQCAGSVVPCLEPDGSVSVMPRSRAPHPPRRDSDIRMVAPPTPRIPWRNTIPSGERTPVPGCERAEVTTLINRLAS